MAFDVSWVGLDLRQKHKILLMQKRRGGARSNLLPNGATLRRLVGGSRLFGKTVDRGGSRRPWRRWVHRTPWYDSVWSPMRYVSRPSD